jgi:hypothetical protein
MAQHPLTQAQMQEAVDALAQHPTQLAAARAVNVARGSFEYRLREASRQGVTPSKGVTNVHSPEVLTRQIKRLEDELRAAAKDALEHAYIKEKILGIEKSVTDSDIPRWVLQTKKGANSPGVPTLVLSDLHFGEVVDPTQVGGVNEYNMAIAKARLHAVGEGAIRLLTIISPEFKYPGIVLVLGGDLVNGNLREESTATNEVNIMPVVLTLYEQIGSLIEMLVEKFGRIFLPCVTGNHGRNTVKTWSSDRHATSFEWLLYNLLAKRYAHDKRISFLIPNGVDANYKIFDTRFLLNHGDSYRGGDGVIGVLGPVVRGDYKKRARNSQINMPYDVQILGHFHQYIHLSKLIINGSLIGYNSYAYIGNFPYEPPCQALFLTHPQHGITFRMPVFAAKDARKLSTAWVSVQ